MKVLALLLAKAKLDVLNAMDKWIPSTEKQTALMECARSFDNEQNVSFSLSYVQYLA